MDIPAPSASSSGPCCTWANAEEAAHLPLLLSVLDGMAPDGPITAARAWLREAAPGLSREWEWHLTQSALPSGGYSVIASA